jgi:hypothetical protein
MRWIFGVSAGPGLCALLSGCLFCVCDGHGTVRGYIVDEQGKAHQGCLVELLDPSDGHVWDYRDISDPSLRETGPGFETGFIVAPGGSSFRIRIGCATSPETLISPTATVGAVDLGVIVLPRKPTDAQ